MSREDFKTLYKADFSSGGAIQNEIVPSHLNNIMILLDVIEQDTNAIIPLRNKIRTLFILYRKGLKDSNRIDDRFTKIGTMIKQWQTKYKNQKPLRLIEELLQLSEDFFMQWNSSGAGILFSAHDANAAAKNWNSIIGKA